MACAASSSASSAAAAVAGTTGHPLLLDMNPKFDTLHFSAAVESALAQVFVKFDAGTNSIKFNLSERGPDGIWQTVVDRAELTRLESDLAAADARRDEAAMAADASRVAATPMVPIRLGDKIIAYLQTGQVMLQAPTEAKFTLAGLAFAQARNSLTFAAGKAGFTTRT